LLILAPLEVFVLKNSAGAVFGNGPAVVATIVAVIVVHAIRVGLSKR